MNLREAGESNRDRYGGVVIVLFAAAMTGTAGAVAGGFQLGDPVLLAVAVALALSSCVLAGVYVAQSMRMTRTPTREENVLAAVSEETPGDHTEDLSVPEPVPPTAWAPDLRFGLTDVLRRTIRWFRHLGAIERVRLGAAVAGGIAILLILLLNPAAYALDTLSAGIATAFCLIGAGIAATAVRYLGAIEAGVFPEGPSLRRGARAIAWMLGLAAVSVVLEWADQRTVLRILFSLVLIVDAAFCYGLFTTKSSHDPSLPIFPLDIGVLSALGNRTNIFASILDSFEKQLGIDLRSTWALSVVRRSLEPLLLGLCLVAWLSTSLTVVGVEEQGLVERLGVPVGGAPLFAGLHLHWPWPIDKVSRIPVRRVQVLEVGHEGEEAPGPENVLWAVEHAPNEFTLLLGNGRDLITVDAGVQFRIVDAKAWRYHCQNPAEALSAIAYRAVMRNTVNLTLSDALSQNVAGLTGRMRAMIQQEADALGLGVEILGFTVGGMHPPVAVAQDYQAVVSAELRKVTTVVNAQVYRAEILPAAEATALRNGNAARAEGAEALGKAAGEAWSFRTLEAQYRAAPALYFFRRRLETLEKGLSDRDFTILDTRFQRDGGELWVIP